ncbi:MAG: class I SAM-dependent RNA methyltransferase [Candidatus Aminicenantes bacterium]|nr:class I SAM-dependent RNA methyltransferase [Candidatus Aminicenantes bacterium]
MTGRVVAIAKGGAGVVRDGARTVFIPGTIAGETVEFTVCGKRRSAWQGTLQRVLEASPRRVDPPCPHYGECGGCNLQHMSYDEQLRSKAGILAANLKRIARVEEMEIPAFLASPGERFRSKVEFQVRGGRAGFFARHSHRVVSVAGCLLLPQAVESFFLARRPLLAAAENARLQVVSNGRDLAARLEPAAGGEEWLGPRRTVRIAIGPDEYRFAPDHFVQSNLFQLQPMLGLLEGVLERERPDTAADLFCGAGFFTLPLARHCRQVAAVESDARSIEALRANLGRSQARNVRVQRADVLRAGLPPAELTVVDPPRGGLTERVIAALAAGPARIVVYFSCDSATFARDLRMFNRHGYVLEEWQPIDNFPHSDHFEIFSLLKKAR